MTITSVDTTSGLALMVREHRQLEVLFDEFERCFGDDAKNERAMHVAGEALDLGNAHFEHEEALMAASHYPGIAEHKFHHRNLRLQFTTLSDDIIANIGKHDPVTIEHLDVLRRLLMEHISGPDSALEAYIRSVDLAPA